MEDQPHAPPPFCINNILPPEIMQFIFKRLETKDLLQAMNVCIYWEDIIMEHNEIDLHIGRRNKNIWRAYDGPPFQPIETMREFRSRRAFISKLENPKEKLPPPIQTEFWRKPELLQYLWIDGYLRKGTFNNILNGLYKLEKLEIHFNVLTSFDLSDNSVLNFNSLVNLKNFAIRIFSRTQNSYKSYEKRLIGFVNLISIFISGVKFPQLECFNLCLPSRPMVESNFSELIGSITFFMMKHKSTLKGFKLFIGCYGGHGEFFVLPAGTHIPQLTGQDLNVLKMKSIEIHSIPYAVNPFFHWMLEFVNGQKHIEIIHLTVDYLSIEQIQQSVPNYSNTIKVIQLSVDTVTTQPLDLNVFSTCIHLKRLELNGSGRGDVIVNYEYLYLNMGRQRIQAEDVDLIGGRLIPKTLEVLTLKHLYISTQDITEILQEQINLQSLHLVYIGTVMNFGISLNTFIRLISERNVEKIFLRNSINTEDSVSVTEVQFQHNEIGGLNIQSLLHHKNKDNKNEISLHLLDDLNYIQIDEDEEEYQLYPDGQDYPHFVIHEYDNQTAKDVFHEYPLEWNSISHQLWIHRNRNRND